MSDSPIPLAGNQLLAFASPLQVPPSCDDCVETWNWVVLLTDGSIVHECQGPGTNHRSFTDTIDTTRVGSIALIPNGPDHPVHQLRIQPGHRAIFFRRRAKDAIGQATEDELAGSHCLGFERTFAGTVTVVVAQCFVFYFDDGHTIVSNNVNPY